MVYTYKFLSQTQDTEINPAGTGFRQVWHSVFEITSGPAKGTTFTITLPASDHTADNVKKEADLHTAQLSAVAAIGGT